MNTKTIFAAPMLLTLVNPAMAHTGDHSTVAVSEIASHLLQSQVHMGLIAAAFVGVVGLAMLFRARKHKR